MNILYVYTNISPAFILFIDIWPPIIPIFPCLLLSIFFSCSSQRRKGINVIYHLTITVGFQLNRSGLENKQTDVIGFFPICTAITIEEGGWYCAWLNKPPTMVALYDSCSHTEFHTPDVPMKKA